MTDQQLQQEEEQQEEEQRQREPPPPPSVEENDDNIEIHTAATSSTKPGGCGQWYVSEVVCRCCTDRPTATMFGAVDVVNDRTIDFDASFQLQAPALVLVVKFLLWGIVVGSFAYGWYEFEYPYWFMAYVSYWAMFYSIVYLTLSFLCSFLVYLPQKDQPNVYIKATWVMYLVAAVHDVLVVLTFWVTEYDPATQSITYFTIASHGMSLAIVLLDGIVINKIPVRLWHYWFCLAFGLLFVAWTLCQGLIPVDNPRKGNNNNDDNSDNNDDGDESLYKILDWEQDPLESAMVSVVMLLVAFPIFTIVFWAISLVGRRYRPLAVVVLTGGNGEDVELQQETSRKSISSSAAISSSRGEQPPPRSSKILEAADGGGGNKDPSGVDSDDTEEDVEASSTTRPGAPPSAE